MKIFAYLIALMLFTVPSPFLLDFTQAQSIWSFQNCFINFDQALNFTEVPYKGIPYNSALVGYWSFDEGIGNIAIDETTNANNGTIINAIWATGRFGAALEFSINSTVKIPLTEKLNVLDNLTLSAWIYPYSQGQNNASRIIAKNDPFDYGMAMGSGGSVNFVTNGSLCSGSGSVSLNEWHYVVITYDKSQNSSQVKTFVDGALRGQATILGNTFKPAEVYIGNRGDNLTAFDGIIDDVKIYNRTLSKGEIAASYFLPDHRFLTNYFNFKDPASNNSMLIYVDTPTNNDEVANVKCTNFFTDNKLNFQATKNVTMNIWTNLGKPVSTTGVWNIENNTTTLLLDASSNAELNWNEAAPPVESNFLINSTVANSITTISFFWLDNKSLSGGGFIFSTNSSGQWANASWASFANNGWANVSLLLYGPVGTSVSFLEYANNSLNAWGSSVIHTISITAQLSSPIPTPKPSSSPYPLLSPIPPTQTPNVTPSKVNQTISSSVVILTSILAIVGLVIVVSLLIKKGRLSIEFIE